MFVDEEIDAVEVKSSWKKEVSLSEASTQTKDLATSEVASQSIKRKNREVQTDDDRDKEFELIEEDTPELAEFLSRVGPYVLKQLDKNFRSHAFDGYEVNWEDETAEVTSIHTLTHAALNQELQVTGLSWNSTGSVIVASFGRFDHEDWCTHKSVLCTWNLDRRSVNTSKPDTAVDLSCCLMCIACHPQKPSLVAGGNFNGEVLVWDLSQEDDTLVATSGIGDDSHREPVSKIQWVADTDSKGKKKFNIVSISSDGKILIWRMSSHKPALKLVDGFVLLTESLPRTLRVRAKRSDQEMGITCITYNCEDSSTFLLGSETGGIFKCSANTRGTPAGSNVVSSVPLRSPVTFTFDPHQGPVYSVEFSPFHRNLFLSCGTDMTARIYSVLQTQPVATIEPGAGYLFSAKWSPVRPLVFSIAAADGSLLIYDLKHSHGAPRYKLEASPKKQPIFTTQFNHKESQLLATGDGAGFINIWRLSDALTHQGTHETDLLEEIAGTALE